MAVARPDVKAILSQPRVLREENLLVGMRVTPKEDNETTSIW